MHALSVLLAVGDVDEGTSMWLGPQVTPFWYHRLQPLGQEEGALDLRLEPTRLGSLVGGLALGSEPLGLSWRRSARIDLGLEGRVGQSFLSLVFNADSLWSARKVFGAPRVSLVLKLIFFASLVLSKLTYNAHVVVPSPRYVKMLNAVFMRVLRMIAGHCRYQHSEIPVHRLPPGPGKTALPGTHSTHAASHFACAPCC